MLFVRSQADDYYKRRACVGGNFVDADPTQRDERLAVLRWSVDKSFFSSQRGLGDFQVWILWEEHPDRIALLSLFMVYVDDFLLQAKQGAMCTNLLQTLAAVSTVAKEEVLIAEHPIVFRGNKTVMRRNSDYPYHQSFLLLVLAYAKFSTWGVRLANMNLSSVVVRAGALVKLAPMLVIQVSHDTMRGSLPPYVISTTLGLGNQGDVIGVGSSEGVYLDGFHVFTSCAVFARVPIQCNISTCDTFSFVPKCVVTLFSVLSTSTLARVASNILSLVSISVASTFTKASEQH